ncbi:MAG: hypothetical protein LH614_14310 [Pyrinomonadaceae bacterium]|nr:hypothetical protein [Pyrinomonadaceae bacterium]
MKMKIQIKSKKYNGEIYLIKSLFDSGSWQQSLNPQVTSSSDEYLKYTFDSTKSRLSLGEQWGDTPRVELIVLSDFDFNKVGKTGSGFKRAHSYSSGQQLDADISLTWTYIGFS